MTRQAIVLGLMLFSCFSCWERQEHAILPPEIPHYTLSGFTIDINDTSQVIPHTPISLTAVTMIYDVTFDTVSIQSDSNGYFRIDSVYPGNYIFTAEKEGYTVINTPLTIEHEDRIYDVQLPESLVSLLYYYAPSSTPNFVWTEYGLWLLGSRLSRRTRDGIIPVIYRLEIDNKGDPVPECKEYVRAPFFEPSGVEAIGRVLYWHSGGLIVSCLIDQQTIFDVSIADSFRVDVPLDDFAWDGSGFWTTFGSSLQYRGTDLRTVEQQWKTDAGRLGPLACNEDAIWSYDINNDLIVKMNREGEVLCRYRPIFFDTDEWVEVHDMDFRGPGLLWVSDRTKRRFFVFITGEL